MKLTYPLYVILVFTVWGLGIWFARGSHIFFFDPPTLMIVCMPALLLSRAYFSSKEIFKAYKLAFDNGSASAVEYKNAKLYFTSLQSYILLAGILGSLLGIILTLISDEVTAGTRVSAWVGTALLSIVYAIILCVTVTIPFRDALQKKINHAN